jgi:hypothetical protein
VFAPRLGCQHCGPIRYGTDSRFGRSAVTIHLANVILHVEPDEREADRNTRTRICDTLYFCPEILKQGEKGGQVAHPLDARRAVVPIQIQYSYCRHPSILGRARCWVAVRGERGRRTKPEHRSRATRNTRWREQQHLTGKGVLYRVNQVPNRPRWQISSVTQTTWRSSSISKPRMRPSLPNGARSPRCLSGHAAATSDLESFNLMRFMSVSSSEPASLCTAAQAGA